MNLALWLDRAGRDDPQRPALGIGPRVLRTYGETAGRVGAARRRAAQALASSPATASPSPPRTARTMSRCFMRSGTPASPPCRPTPSCTAPSSATSSNNPARGCALPPTDSTARSRRTRRTVSSALIVIGSAEYRTAFRRRPDRGRAARRRRSRLAVLHLRHDRPAEGRDADPSRAGGGEPRLSQRGRCRRARRSDPARRADEPRLRPLHHAACHAARRQRRAGIRRLRAGGNLPVCFAPGRAPRCSPRPPWSSGWSKVRADCPSENIRTIIWGGAPMYVEDALQGARPLRPAARADLRPGRMPDDHHDPVAARTSPAAIIRAGWSGWRPPAGPMRCVEVMVADEQDRPLPAGETGEILVPRRCRDGRLLAEPGGERGHAQAAASCTPATSAPSTPTAI